MKISKIMLSLLVVSLMVVPSALRADEGEEGGGSFELCTNGIDDNENGLTDAQDPACADFYRILTVVKHVVGTTTAPDAFSFTVTGPAGSVALGTHSFEADGENNFAGTTIGSYVVTEMPVTGYIVTYDNCGTATAGDNALTLTNPGAEEETCTITNTYIPTEDGGGDDSGTTTDATSTPPTDGGSSGNNGVHHGYNKKKGSSSNSGQVLGASTEACVPLITNFLGRGYANAPADVLKLQAFLNTDLGLSMPLSGIFGQDTEEAVHAFQKKYWIKVLAPWFLIADSFIADEHDSTGIVYKTTLHKINDINCATETPLPQLP